MLYRALVLTQLPAINYVLYSTEQASSVNLQYSDQSLVIPVMRAPGAQKTPWLTVILRGVNLLYVDVSFSQRISWVPKGISPR